MESSEPVGLPSVGLTCYASCMLQVLRNTKSFVQFLEKYAPRKDPETLSDILLNVLEAKNHSKLELKQDIRHLLVFLESIDDTFDRNSQNDCASFLHILLDTLKRDEHLKVEFDHFFIDLFDEIECGDCKKIEQLGVQRVLSIHSTTNIAKILNLNNIQEEVLEKGSLKCNNCHKSNELLKRSRLHSCPSLLMFQIQRILDTNHGLIKRKDPVQFDLTLNVEAHEPSKTREKTYELYAVVYHVGDLEGGHYFCAVKRDIGWFFCDNEVILKCRDNQEVLKFEDAYILFYELK